MSSWIIAIYGRLNITPNQDLITELDHITEFDHFTEFRDASKNIFDGCGMSKEDALLTPGPIPFEIF